jgi:hypothetical protein
MTEQENVNDVPFEIPSENQIRQSEPAPALADPVPIEPPKTIKCKLEQWFHPNFVALMQAAPQNKLVLGKMMATLGVMPPPELVTFNELRNWVEMTFDDPKNKKAMPQVRPSTPEFSIGFSFCRNVEGTCDYTMSESASDTCSVTLDEIRDWVEEGKSIDRIAELIEEKARENCEPNWSTDEGSEEYSDYETTDYTNETASRDENYDRFERRLRDYLQQHDPELLEDLDNN